MENKRWTGRQKERMLTKDMLDVREPKLHGHKRKHRTYLAGWHAMHDQFKGLGIEEYQAEKAGFCSKVYIVVATDRLDDPSNFLPISEWRRAAVVNSEYLENGNGAPTGIFCTDLIGSYLRETQSETLSENTAMSVKAARVDSRRRNKLLSQHRKLYKQTSRENEPKESSINILNSQSDTFLPKHESLRPRSPSGKVCVVRQTGTKARENQVHRGDEDSHGSFPKINPRPGAFISCPSHFYAFQRGLIPSCEAFDLDWSLQPQPALPPVIADRLGKTSEQKNYRLTLEKDENKQQRDNNFQLFPCSYHSSSQENNEYKEGQKVKRRTITCKTLSAEAVIPVAQTKREYFDFQGYIEFLFKERNIRRTSARHSVLRLRSYCDEQYDLQSSPDSWLESFGTGTIFLRDVLNYDKMLDVKGCRMTLDETPIQIRHKMTLNALPEQNAHENCCFGNSKKCFAKPKIMPKQKQKTKKERTVVIERLPSKFHFTMPGRPPSSNDSGFVE